MGQKIKAKFIGVGISPIYECLLNLGYDIELSDRPDYLFYTGYTTWHNTWRDRTAVKVFVSREIDQPLFYECDYGLTYIPSDHPRSYRLSHAELALALNGNFERTEADIAGALSPSRQFCYFLASGDWRRSDIREGFFTLLSQYKKVDSGGERLNNIGRVIPREGAAEDEWRRQYKFALAFENYSAASYTTEKLTNAYMYGAVPIYWGDPSVATEYNPKAFINAHDFTDFTALIEYIKQVDSDDALYQAYYNEPLLKVGTVRAQSLLRHFDHIFSAPPPRRERRPLRKMYFIFRFRVIELTLHLRIHKFLSPFARTVRAVKRFLVKKNKAERRR